MHEERYEEQYGENQERIDREKKQQEEIKRMLSEPLKKGPKLSQLEADAINVLEKRVEITSFPKEYQQQIKNFYRFSPLNMESSNSSASGSRRNSWK